MAGESRNLTFPRRARSRRERLSAPQAGEVTSLSKQTVDQLVSGSTVSERLCWEYSSSSFHVFTPPFTSEHSLQACFPYLYFTHSHEL